jgi:radical SAM protein with 4Fe4S-binding SPASM domain
MECPQIPRITYPEFGKRLYEAAGHRRTPWAGSIEVTARCNLKCVHCYIACDAGDSEAQKRELNVPELQRILDEIVDEGCLCLLLTGGEPLIRPDFLDVYLYAKKKGLILTLFSNGTMINREIADFLAEWPPRGVEITLYGASEETYEAVTCVPGSYARCVRGIALLLDRGLPLTLKTMLMTINKHELGAMQDYAARLGLEFRYDPCVNFRLNRDSTPALYRISPEEIVEFDRTDERRMQAMRRLVEKLGAPPPMPEKLYYCSAGEGIFHIDPYGRLNVCMLSRQPGYDLRAGSFRDGWERALPDTLAQTRKDKSPCVTCSLSALCDQCPGWGALEWNAPEKPVEFVCRIARLRGEALGMTKTHGS